MCCIFTGERDRLRRFSQLGEDLPVLLYNTIGLLHCGAVITVTRSSIVLQASTPCMFSFSLPGAKAGDRVTSLAFCAENDVFVFGTVEGSLYTMDVVRGDVEEVGMFDSAVLVLEVSPDGQTIGIITAAGKLLLMNHHWEVEGETPLHMAIENQLPVVQEETVQLLEGSVALSWRGDGQVFCTLSRASDECALAASDADVVPTCPDPAHALNSLPLQASSVSEDLEPHRLHSAALRGCGS